MPPAAAANELGMHVLEAVNAWCEAINEQAPTVQRHAVELVSSLVIAKMAGRKVPPEALGRARAAANRILVGFGERTGRKMDLYPEDETA